MLDTSAIARVITSAILALEDEFTEGEVRSVALVVEVDDGEAPTQWRVHGDDRAWLNRVVLEMGLGQLDEEGQAGERTFLDYGNDEDEDE